LKETIIELGNRCGKGALWWPPAGIAFRTGQKGKCGNTKGALELANVPEGRIKEEALRNEESRFKEDA
jgi:hypothetical protein